MAEVLVLVEHVENRITPTTAALFAAASGLGPPAAVVVGPPGTAERLSDELATHGATTIYGAETDSPDDLSQSVEALAALVRSHRPAAVLASASAHGKEIAARVAATTGSTLINDAVAVHGGPTIRAFHQVPGTPVLAESTSTTAHPVMTLRLCPPPLNIVRISSPPVPVDDRGASRLACAAGYPPLGELEAHFR